MKSFYNELINNSFNNIFIEPAAYHKLNMDIETAMIADAEYEKELEKFNVRYNKYISGSNEHVLAVINGIPRSDIQSLRWAFATDKITNSAYRYPNEYLDVSYIKDYPVAIAFSELNPFNTKIYDTISYLFIVEWYYDKHYCSCRVFKDLNLLLTLSNNSPDSINEDCYNLYMAKTGAIGVNKYYYKVEDIYKKKDELIGFKKKVLNKEIQVDQDMYKTIQNLQTSDFGIFKGIILSALIQEYNFLNK